MCTCIKTIVLQRKSFLSIYMDDRIPREKLEFLQDQKSKRRMLMSLSLYGKFNSITSFNQSKCFHVAATESIDEMEPSCSSTTKIDMKTGTKLHPRKVSSYCEKFYDAETSHTEEVYLPAPVIEGNSYLRKC